MSNTLCLEQMIEGQIAEFEAMAANSKASSESWERSALDWDIKNPHVAMNHRITAAAADTQSKTLTLCADRLRNLLKVQP